MSDIMLPFLIFFLCFLGVFLAVWLLYVLIDARKKRLVSEDRYREYRAQRDCGMSACECMYIEVVSPWRLSSAGSAVFAFAYSAEDRYQAERSEFHQPVDVYLCERDELYKSDTPSPLFAPRVRFQRWF